LGEKGYSYSTGDSSVTVQHDTLPYSRYQGLYNYAHPGYNTYPYNQYQG
nr:RecName: Full=Cuticle protein 10; AltName: Full=LpCP10 [Limulus polyphemus]